MRSMCTMFLFMIGLFGCGGSSGSTPSVSSNAQAAKTLTSIEVSPKNNIIPVGLTKQFTAKSIYSDNSTQDLPDTAVLAWRSSDTTVADISKTGIATPRNPGVTNIKAVFANFSSITTLTVKLGTTPPTIPSTTPAAINGTWVGKYTINDSPSNIGEKGKVYEFKFFIDPINGNTITGIPTLRGIVSGENQKLGTMDGNTIKLNFTYWSEQFKSQMVDAGTAYIVGDGDVMTGEVTENYNNGYICTYTFTLTKQ